MKEMRIVMGRKEVDYLAPFLGFFPNLTKLHIENSYDVNLDTQGRYKSEKISFFQCFDLFKISDYAVMNSDINIINSISNLDCLQELSITLYNSIINVK